MEKQPTPLKEPPPDEASGEADFMARMVSCQSRLYRFIATLIPNRTDAEDLFQKTCLSAWQSRKTFDLSCEMFPWLCGVARNHVREYFREQNKSPLQFAPELIEQLAERQLSEDSVLQQRQQALAKCLERLPARQRSLLADYYAQSQDVKDISSKTGFSVDAIYKAMQRIRAVLFDCINKTLAEAYH